MSMDVEFQGDVHEPRVQSWHNISEVERWTSMAAGTALALYGLSRRNPRGWMLTAFGGLLLRRGMRGHCDVYDALGVSTARRDSDTRRYLGGSRGVNVEERVTINRRPSEVYGFWRNLENLPRFMQHLESVERITETLSRWKARGPAAATLEWNAEIINEIPNKLLAWRSIEGSEVITAGSVHFDEAGRGRTRVRVRLQYSPPGGKTADAVARWLGSDAATEIREDLQHFKQMLESSVDSR
jgi:uncharacterized membrane protein